MKFKKNEKILISACLSGVNCKYNGINKRNLKVEKIIQENDTIMICPEIMAGLGTPRPPAEITKGTGADVLNKKAKVLDKNGNDYTEKFIVGAKKALNVAKTLNIKKAILKSKSPSCGFGKTYDGTFSNKLIEGNGVTAEILSKNGIKIITEKDL